MVVAVAWVKRVVMVSRLVDVDVTMAVSVTVVVSGVWGNHEEQKLSPMVGSAVIAAKHW